MKDELTQIEIKMRGYMIVQTLANLFIAAMVAFFIVQALDNHAARAQLNRDGITCVFDKLNDHRLNDFNAHQLFAKELDAEFDAPAPAPEPLPQEYIAACERFLTTR